VPEVRGRGEGREGMRSGEGLPTVVLLLLGTLAISTAYGMLLLLPLYVQELGGNEASFGVVLSSAAVPAVLCIGLLIRYPERLRPHAVVAIAIAVYALGAAGASLVSGNWTPLIGIGVLLGTAWAVVYTATPMVMSGMVTDQGRATYFGYLTGAQQVGIGAGPRPFPSRDALGLSGHLLRGRGPMPRGRGADGRGGAPDGRHACSTSRGLRSR
jgi:Major Facilitator Superfamily